MTSAHDSMQPMTSHAASGLAGKIRVAGDKSISHRALMLASQVIGTTTIHGLLEGEDVLRTADALRSCGVDIKKQLDGSWVVRGVGIGGLNEPYDILDMGNAGTGARLMMGLLTPYSFTSHFTGDDSLRSRPMQRVITPLSQMGGDFLTKEGGKLPLALKGARHPMPITYELPVASAQVKSAIMLAALNTPGITTVIEKEATRDHTERMMNYFGIPVNVSKRNDGATIIEVKGQIAQTYKDHEFEVPCDPSSAAFPIVAALITPRSDITVEHVCLNPLRTGLLETLKEMGADITISNQREIGGETVGDIRVRSSVLQPITVPASRAPSMIDEYPILAVAAAMAHGRSVFHGLSELRVKESNRLSAIIEGLNRCGIDALEEGDSIIIHGRHQAPKGGCEIPTHYDHRIAMSFLVMGLVSEYTITVDDARAIATSFPNFVPLMCELGASIASASNKIKSPHRKLVIAVDGPAASGKGTLARRLADHFGLAYLDTGSLYRAVGMRVLYANKDPYDVAAVIAAARSIQDHDLANPKLRSEKIGKAASIVSAIPEVREALLDYQRNFAKRESGAVLDGRDIGTVVCPDADVKLFITASIETRTARRHKELSEMGVTVDYESVKEDLLERDKRDSERTVAPLKPADDAATIDTSEFSANQVLEQALEIIG
ncbi:MAG: 3-phosphoshikimate 1-carboxyvinyltransferase [Rickettsiales bacterium]